jgi:hypothetical protein
MKSARKKTKAIPKFVGRFNPAEGKATPLQKVFTFLIPYHSFCLGDQ